MNGLSDEFADRQPAPTTSPLCVDLDGTLIRTDLLYESLFLCLRSRPWIFVLLPLWICRGRTYLKAKLAEGAELDASTLPYRQDLLEYLQSEKKKGRQLILVTGSHETLAQVVAKHLNFFETSLASNKERNLTGSNKADFLIDRYGERGFDYIGNAKVDLAIWKHANQAMVVSSSPYLIKRARQVSHVERVFADTTFRNQAAAAFKGMRPHQWAKNLLLFVPLLAAHDFYDLDHLLKLIIAFCAFSLLASSIYLFNDLLDIQADRNHHDKRNRPLASGNMSIPQAVGLSSILLLLGCTTGFTVNLEFTIVLLLYFGINLSYSLFLKKKALVDVICLGGLYTLRLFAGAQAGDVKISNWLLSFSLFFFVSLAICKRVAELSTLHSSPQKKTRGYWRTDLEVLSQLGVSSGLMSLVVLTLYINNPATILLYRYPDRLWLLVPIFLYWIARVWLMTWRDEMHSDPVLFALSDRPSYVVVAALIGITLWAV